MNRPICRNLTCVRDNSDLEQLNELGLPGDGTEMLVGKGYAAWQHHESTAPSVEVFYEVGETGPPTVRVRVGGGVPVVVEKVSRL